MTVLVERPYLQQNADTLQNVMMALIEGMLYTGHPRNKSIVLETLAKQFRMTDSAAAEGAYQDVATLVRLEEGRKPLCLSRRYAHPAAPTGAAKSLRSAASKSKT
jgi:hypothetical protein